MTIECAICGKTLASQKSASSKRHIQSKQHQMALGNKVLSKKRDLPIKKTAENQYFADLILFNAVKSFKMPTYLKILEFCSSFNIKTEVINSRLQNRIQIGDILYNNINDHNVKTMISDILRKPRMKYPYIIPIQSFLQEFPSLHFSDYNSIIQFLQHITHQYPGYLRLSSSKLGYPADLISFNHLFPNSVYFTLSNRWGTLS